MLKLEVDGLMSEGWRMEGMEGRSASEGVSLCMELMGARHVDEVFRLGGSRFGWLHHHVGWDRVGYVA